VLHPRVADRIAANLSEVKRKKGDKEAQMWWGSRFPGMIRADYDEVVRALQRRAGNVTR
jgi:hypothetical protein